MTESLRGQLLVASPSLHDYFRRTIVLVIEHTDDGAMGVVLNRPSEALVADAVPALASLAPEELVRVGGPLSPQAVVALGDFSDPSQAGKWVADGIGVFDPDRAHDSLERLRVYAGYAGWDAGQLDDEIEQDAWIVEAAHPDDPFSYDDIWAEVLQRKGGPYALLATMPADLSLN